MKNTIFNIIFIFVILTSCQKDDTPDVPPVLNSENLITTFQLNIQGTLVSGMINQDERLITFDTEDADLTSLVPTIIHSDKSTLSPTKTLSQNFNNEVVYTVTAENGDANVYRVVVNNLNSSTDILSFQLLIDGKSYEGNVDNTSKTLYVETDNTLEDADIVFSLPNGATVSPVNEGFQNFYLPVEYVVTAENGNTSTFTLTTKAFKFFDNTPKLFYSNAQAGVTGTGIDMSIPDAAVILENGHNSYTLQNVIVGNSSTYSNGMVFNNFRFNFPDNIVTATDYKLKYLIDGEVKTTSDFNIDVVADDVPVITSFNQEKYARNDILIIKGENLTETISIPSNGSIFIIENSHNYDLTVNNERTELTLTLDYYYLFPSYFGRPEQEKAITLYGPNRRVGTYAITVFK